MNAAGTPRVVIHDGRRRGRMSQRHVETFIGRLVTDEELRRRFKQTRDAVIDQMKTQGMELTAVERDALAHIDADACDEFAATLDPRLQKARLKWPIP